MLNRVDSADATYDLEVYYTIPNASVPNASINNVTGQSTIVRLNEI